MGKISREMANLLLGVCLLLAGGLAAQVEQLAACPEKVAAVEAACRASTAEQLKQAKESCGSVGYQSKMAEATKLRDMAAKQSKAIEEAVKALAEAKKHAEGIASSSGQERKVLLDLLDQQKQGQKMLQESKKQENSEHAKLGDLKLQADHATEAAVSVAKETDDQAKVQAAKVKAHSMYQTYVDFEIKMASVERKVSEAKKKLEDITNQVEKEIEKAKATADKEAAALKEVAQRKMDLAAAKKVQAVMDVKASGVASRAALESEHVLKAKLEQSAKDVQAAAQNMKRAQEAERKAYAAQMNASLPEVKSYALDMPRLQKMAREQAQQATPPASATQANPSRPEARSKSPPKDGDVHEHYASEVKHIEKERTKAAEMHKAAQAEVERLAKAGAPKEKIEAARKDVKSAAANMERLVSQQNAAVAKVVDEIKGLPSLS